MRLQKRVLVSGLAALFGVMVLLMVGCGDDDGATAPTTITGQLDDPEFVAVQGQINDFVDSTVSFFKSGLNTIDGISDGGVIIPPQYAVNPEQQDNWDTTFTNDGWYEINIAYTHRNAQDQPVWQTTLNDSVQYQLNSLVLMDEFNTRDQLLFKHHWSFDVFDTTVSHFAIAGNADFTFDGLNSALSTITGTRDLSVHVKQVTAFATIWRDFNFTADVNHVTLKRSAFTGWSQCPVGGSVSAEIEMVYQEDDNDPVISTWNFTVTFNQGTMLASVTRGNTVWSYSGNICNVPQ